MATPPPMYDGRPRSEYGYSGMHSDVFGRWQSGEIGTRLFQTQTASGHGTAALTNKTTGVSPVPTGGSAEGGVPTGLLVGAGLAAVALLRRRSK